MADKVPGYENVTGIGSLLECQICMSYLNNPKVLHCNHTFCKDCLDGLLQFNPDGSATIECPLRCKGSTNIPSNETTEQLGVVYQFKEVIEKYKEKHLVRQNTDGSFFCAVCESDVTIFCSTCNAFYCKTCQNEHNDHSTVPVTFCESMDQYRPVCRKHMTVGKFICCKDIICVYCQNRNHNGHKYETFKEHADRVKQLFRNANGTEKIEKVMQNALLNYQTTMSDFNVLRNTLVKILKNRLFAYIQEQITAAEKESVKILDEFDNVVRDHMNLYKDLSPSEMLKTVTQKHNVELILMKDFILKEYSRYTTPVPTLTISLTKPTSQKILGTLDVQAGTFLSIGGDEIQASVVSKIPEPKIVHDVEHLVKKLEDMIKEVDGKLSSCILSPTYSENKPAADVPNTSKQTLEEALLEVEKRGREYLDELFTNRKEKLIINMVKTKPEVAKLQEANGTTLLHSAAQYGFDKLAQYLLESKLLDANVRQKFKQTPLHYAAFHNKPSCVMVLLTYDSDINAKNHKGNRPVDVAKQYKSVDALHLLEKAEQHIYEVVP